MVFFSLYQGFKSIPLGFGYFPHSASKTVMTDIYWVLKRYLLWFYYRIPCQKLMIVNEEPKSIHIIKSLSLKGRQILTIKTAMRDTWLTHTWLTNIFVCECYSSTGKRETGTQFSFSENGKMYHIFQNRENVSLN